MVRVNDWIMSGGLLDNLGDLDHVFSFLHDDWDVPSMVIVEVEDLYWDVGCPTTRRSPGKGMLRQFLLLADGTNAQIENYACEWGPLHLCPRGMPATKMYCPWCTARERLSGKDSVWCHEEPHVNWACESIGYWRFYSNLARALIFQASAGLQRGEHGQIPSIDFIRDWLAYLPFRDIRGLAHDLYKRLAYPGVVRPGSAERPPAWEKSHFHYISNIMRQDTPDVVSHGIDAWLDLGGVRPRLVWQNGQRDMMMSYRGLFGALGLAICLAVARANKDIVPRCAVCGEIVHRDRRPPAGKPIYCKKPECQREATRRRQERKRAKEKA